MFFGIFGSTANTYSKIKRLQRTVKIKGPDIKTLRMHLTGCMISSWLMEQHKKKRGKRNRS